PVPRAHPAVGGEERLGRRDERPPGEHRLGPLDEPGEQAGEVGRGGDLPAPGGESVRGHHARTPVVSHATGRTRAPAATAASHARAGSPPTRKNMHPPAPDPAALPPSAPAVRIAASSRRISGVAMAGSSAV